MVRGGVGREQDLVALRSLTPPTAAEEILLELLVVYM